MLSNILYFLIHVQISERFPWLALPFLVSNSAVAPLIPGTVGVCQLKIYGGLFGIQKIFADKTLN